MLVMNRKFDQLLKLLEELAKATATSTTRRENEALSKNRVTPLFIGCFDARRCPSGFLAS